MSSTYDLEQSTDTDQVVDEADQDATVAPVQYDISSYGADYDVEGLVRRLNRDDILIPAFQRNYVWNQKEASRFIESLLLGLPVPAVFLARERDSNKLLVIDGQQRLKSLQFFYEGFFDPVVDEKKKTIFKLINVQSKFDGRTCETLEERDRIKLNDSIIHAIVVKQESPADEDTSIYHIFERLNSQGRILTPQEIRSAIDHGVFLELIKTLNDYGNWREIFGPRSKRLKDQELILRFLAFYYEADNYQRPVNEFLSKFSGRHRKANRAFLEDSGTLFRNTIDLAWHSFGRAAFRPVKPLNAAVFDSVMVGLARRLAAGPVGNYDRVKDAYSTLISDVGYSALVSQSTSDENNVATRFRMATDAFAEV